MKIEVQNKFQEFISDCLNSASDECLRVGCFLFAVLTINKTNKLRVLYDEFIYGWCIEEDDLVKTLVSPTGLAEYQVEKGLVELVKLGLFEVSIDRKVRQASIELKEL